jgi:hypothetical protein
MNSPHPSIVRSSSDIRREGSVFAKASQNAHATFSGRKIPFSELAEQFPDDRVPFLDRPDIDESTLTPLQKQWRNNGYVVLPKFVSADLIEEYERLRAELKLGKAFFDSFVPYQQHDVIRRITLNARLKQVLDEIMGQDMGLHFVLTAYHSTERGWHQDDYLNPEYVYSNYCAAWISLGNIDPQAGPFEFIADSHKWPCMRRHLVQQQLAGEWATITESAAGGKGHWAEYAEIFTNEAYVQEIERQDAPILSFIAEPGDVLIWHGKLVHRGSSPLNPALSRPAMISHFSGITARSDIGTDIRRYGSDGCHYWHFEQKT